MARSKQISFFLIDDFNDWLYNIGKKRGQYDSYINTRDLNKELSKIDDESGIQKGIQEAIKVVNALLKCIDKDIDGEKNKTTKKTLQSKRSGLRSYKRFLSYLPSNYIKYTYNGIDELANLIGNTRTSLIEHMVSSSFFPSQELAKQRANEIANLIGKDKRIPSRFSTGKKYCDAAGNEIKFSSRKIAVDATRKKDYYFIDNNLKVEIDSNGNYTICDYLSKNTKINITSGYPKRNCYGYMICHVWGNAINPLFFSNFWNIVLIPQYLSFITDKGNEMASVKYAKDLYKAIAYVLYKDSIDIINQALRKKNLAELDIKEPEEDIMKDAQEIIKMGLIKYIP